MFINMYVHLDEVTVEEYLSEEDLTMVIVQFNVIILKS